MLKIVEIAKAWIAAANPTPKQKQIAEYRISVCDVCPHKQYHKHIDTFTCGLCGCPLNKKIFSPLPGEQACPDKRWEK
jgi:ribosomal protein L37E